MANVFISYLYNLNHYTNWLLAGEQYIIIPYNVQSYSGFPLLICLYSHVYNPNKYPFLGTNILSFKVFPIPVELVFSARSMVLENSFHRPPTSPVSVSTGYFILKLHNAIHWKLKRIKS